MTTQQMYKQIERLYAQVNWNSRESIHRYNEAVRELHKLREMEDEKNADFGHRSKDS